MSSSAGEQRINPAPLPGGPLQGQIALVTGATVFVGRAIAPELERCGAHVIVHDHNLEAEQAVINEIAANGYSATSEQADLTSSEAVHAMVDAGRVATVGESFIGGATGGMMQMCRVLACELGRDGIRVNSEAMSYIWDAEPRWGPGSPALEGGHDTGMVENLRKRMLFPVHCQVTVNAAAIFVGPESDAITGQTLSVNGGLSTPG